MKANIVVSVTALIGIVACSTAAPILTDTPIAEWETGKESFLRKLVELKDGVIAELKTLEEKAREKGNLAEVKRCIAEREAFEDENKFPSLIRPRAYDQGVKSALAKLQQTAGVVQKELLKAHQDADAEQVAQELQAISAAPTAGAWPAKNTAQPSIRGTLPSKNSDSRQKWLNDSYKSSVVFVKDDQWEERANDTGKLMLTYKETARTTTSIDFYCAERDQKLRILDNRMEYFKGGKWEWVASGRWASGK